MRKNPILHIWLIMVATIVYFYHLSRYLNPYKSWITSAIFICNSCIFLFNNYILFLYCGELFELKGCYWLIYVVLKSQLQFLKWIERNFMTWASSSNRDLIKYKSRIASSLSFRNYLHIISTIFICSS